MISLRIKLAFVSVAVLLAVLGGLVASWQASQPAIRQRVDGVAMVHTRDAGWQVEKPGDYADTLTGGLVAEYGRALGFETPRKSAPVVPAALPHASGQCGEDSGIPCE